MSERSRLSLGEAFSFESPRKIAVVGAGRVGRAFGRVLWERGHAITAVSSRTPKRAASFAEEVGARATTPPDAVASANVVIVAVPDDALGVVVAEIAGSVQPGTFVVHTCGRFGVSPLAACGDLVAAVHPGSPVSAESIFEGIAFGVTCSNEVWPVANAFARELGGFPVRVIEERRPLYHAALVMASNFATVAVADALTLADRDVILPLMRATVENLVNNAPGDALTGPVVRGDAGTVRAHLAAIDEHAPHLREMYVAASRRLIEQSRQAGRLDDEGAARIEEALQS